MREITEIILHCSATKEGKDVSAAKIDEWHKKEGFLMIGYHYVIRLDGSIEEGRPLSMVGAHCVGHNRNSIGICYVGGLDKDRKPKDTRTEQQRTALLWLVQYLKIKYPQAEIHCHNEFARKACPCFSIEKFRKELEHEQR